METIELAVMVTQIGGPTAYTDELAVLRPNTEAFGRALFSSTHGEDFLFGAGTECQQFDR
jgi:hypothetical protein